MELDRNEDYSTKVRRASVLPMMTKITPQIAGCTVTGYLYDSDDPRDPGQDMIEVRGQNGITVDAGWIPEGDADGSYQIAVCQGMRHLRPVASTRDIHEAAKLVSELAEQFCAPQAATSE